MSHRVLGIPQCPSGLIFCSSRPLIPSVFNIDSRWCQLQPTICGQMQQPSFPPPVCTKRRQNSEDSGSQSGAHSDSQSKIWGMLVHKSTQHTQRRNRPGTPFWQATMPLLSTQPRIDWHRTGALQRQRPHAPSQTPPRVTLTPPPPLHPIHQHLTHLHQLQWEMGPQHGNTGGNLALLMFP